MRWYVVEQGTTVGPLEASQVQQMVQLGRLGPNSPCMPEGAPGWGTIAQHGPMLGLAPAPMMGGMVPPPPPSGFAYGAVTPMGGALVGGLRWASWGSRLLALIIDTIVLQIPLFLVTKAFGWKSIEVVTEGSQTSIHWNGPGFALSILVPIVYYSVLNARGQTIGKMVCKIRVADAATGQQIGLGRGFGRYLISMVFWMACGIPGLIDHLAPLWDANKQSWHDKVVRSVVVTTS